MQGHKLLTHVKHSQPVHHWYHQKSNMGFILVQPSSTGSAAEQSTQCIRLLAAHTYLPKQGSHTATCGQQRGGSNSACCKSSCQMEMGLILASTHAGRKHDWLATSHSHTPVWTIGAAQLHPSIQTTQRFGQAIHRTFLSKSHSQTGLDYIGAMQLHSPYSNHTVVWASHILQTQPRQAKIH